MATKVESTQLTPGGVITSGLDRLPVEWATPIAPMVSDANTTDYATFITSKSSQYAKLSLAIPGLKEPDVVLVRQQGDPIKLDPFRFMLCTARQFWVDADNAGNIRRAWVEKPPFDKTIKEQVETVIFAHHLGVAYPCRCTFKSTKSSAAKTAAGIIEVFADAALTAKWVAQGKAYSDAMAAPKPWLRFTTQVSCTQRTSKGEGNIYWAGEGTVIPATPTDWQAVATFLKGDGGFDKLNAITEAYNQRVKQIEAIAKRT